MKESLVKKVVWHGGELSLMELCSLWAADASHLLRGCVVGALNGVGFVVQYEVRCDSSWHARRTWIDVSSPPERRQLTLSVDQAGRWTADDEAMDELEGLIDIDLGVTPSTNTLPIRRLDLDIGESADVTAVWVRLPNLHVSRLAQRYRRISTDEYEYSSRGGEFEARLHVDEHGLVTRYGSYWTAV